MIRVLKKEKIYLINFGARKKEEENNGRGERRKERVIENVERKKRLREQQEIDNREENKGEIFFVAFHLCFVPDASGFKLRNLA